MSGSVEPRNADQEIWAATPRCGPCRTGGRYATLSLATSETWKDKNSGERKEKTEWHRVVVFDERLVDVAEKYLKKGSKVYVEGQLCKPGNGPTRTGVEKYSTEVVLQKFRGELTMLDSRKDGADGADGADANPPPQSGGDDFAFDDAVPF